MCVCVVRVYPLPDEHVRYSSASESKVSLRKEARRHADGGFYVTTEPEPISILYRLPLRRHISARVFIFSSNFLLSLITSSSARISARHSAAISIPHYIHLFWGWGRWGRWRGWRGWRGSSPPPANPLINSHLCLSPTIHREGRPCTGSHF